MTDQKLVLCLAVPRTKTNQTYEKKKTKVVVYCFRQNIHRVNVSFFIFRGLHKQMFPGSTPAKLNSAQLRQFYNGCFSEVRQPCP